MTDPLQFNKDLWKELENLNKEPFKKKEYNRYYYWEEEKLELMPLPSMHYGYMERRTAKVSRYCGCHCPFLDSRMFSPKTEPPGSVIKASLAILRNNEPYCAFVFLNPTLTSAVTGYLTTLIEENH